MARLIAILLLCAAPLCAAYESNFGRVILANSDLVVHGVASATRVEMRSSTKVELTIESVLHGDEKQTEVFLFYNDPDLLKKGEAVRGLFALKKLAEGGYSLVGKPVLTPAGDAEEADKLRVARAFIALENEAEGEGRTARFWELLVEHLKLGGYPAQNAAVELMFVARDRGTIITEQRFDDVVAARDSALNRLTKQTKEDLKLACQGMVEAKVKNAKFKRVRRGKDKSEQRQAAEDLSSLQVDYPRAFTEEDAKLADALGKDSDDTHLNEKLNELAKAIRAEIRIREAAERDKAREAGERVKHAGE
ncbi:MAG: hypothetical protein H6841_09260 [Planctomycetes bacterium]|nr:hypothetical protein [Planctomycetota bacterium]MCB9936411.1 hypothetical protein [Planctomycetota bacterium]